MPSRIISDLPRFHISPVAPALANILAYSSLSLRGCILNLRQSGYQDFRLNNGAVGRFIYRETRQNDELRGSYFGFALMGNRTGEYKIYGRMVGGVDIINGRRCAIDGYGVIEKLQPENTSTELARDRATAAFVASAIKEGYSGIGTALMQLGMGLAVMEGLAGIFVLQSLSAESDNFYRSVGFTETAPGQWFLPLEIKENDLDMPLAAIKHRPGIDADWRPIDRPMLPAISLPYPTPLAPPPLYQRVMNYFFGRSAVGEQAT